MAEQCFIVFDQRALSGDTSDALVMVTCGSIKEARTYARHFPGCPVFVVDLVGTDGNREGINERFVEVLKG